MESLSRYNLILACIHLILGVGFMVYFTYVNRKYPNDPVEGVELSVRNHRFTTTGWKSEVVQTADIQTIQVLLVGFFLITALFHGIYYMTRDGLYTQLISSGNNYLRWIEYSITSTMMLYIIAWISGVKDENIYKSIFAINVAMIYTGQLVEEKIQKGESWYIPMVLGFVLLMTEFLIIIRDFQNRMDDVQTILKPSGKSFPQWIKYMIWVLFVFFSSFGFISLYGAYSNQPYVQVERLYLVFSLLAKATLAGFIAYGTSQRQAAERQTQ